MFIHLPYRSKSGTINGGVLLAQPVIGANAINARLDGLDLAACVGMTTGLVDNDKHAVALVCCWRPRHRKGPHIEGRATMILQGDWAMNSAIALTLALPALLVFPHRPPVPRVWPSMCPLTMPNSSTPPNELPRDLQHGNGVLWTELWPGSKVVIPPENVAPDGHLFMKWGWWRAERGQPLAIEGRRLDAPAPPLEAEIPEGYDGTHFQATTLLFSSEGCWEVTGRVGDDSLTFVVLVVKDERRTAGTS